MSQIKEIITISDRIASDSELLVKKVSAINFFGGGVDPFVFGLTAFVLACFVGYFVVWKVTPALHTPLMSVTNAISGVILIGAIIALGAAKSFFIGFLSFIAIILASINIVGGFVVTWRMLEMFKKKPQETK
ncbi:MAG: transhydrogenase (AB-specific) [Rickettsiaceae bacterium]|jgi:NAD(P) transhydrogenase subunit alpha|nr:transhydrogenase (AB-specific) [Rickettsiaceae bacterium]